MSGVAEASGFRAVFLAQIISQKYNYRKHIAYRGIVIASDRRECGNLTVISGSRFVGAGLALPLKGAASSAPTRPARKRRRERDYGEDTADL